MNYHKYRTHLITKIEDEYEYVDGDYRSVQNGAYNDVNTWEQFVGGGWVTPTIPPTTGNYTVVVRNTHNVNFTHIQNISNLIIQYGGKILHNSTVTITLVANATQDFDLQIYGTWERVVFNTLSIGSGAKMIVKNHGRWLHAHTGTGGTLPINTTWEYNSVLEIANTVGTNGSFTGGISPMGGFGIVVYNRPNQTSTTSNQILNFNDIRNKLIIQDTGTGRGVEVCNSGRITTNWSGDLEILKGNFNVVSDSVQNTTFYIGRVYMIGGQLVLYNQNTGLGTCQMVVRKNLIVEGGNFGFTNSGVGNAWLHLVGSLRFQDCGFTGTLPNSTGFLFRGNGNEQTVRIGNLSSPASNILHRFYLRNDEMPSNVNEVYFGTDPTAVTISGTGANPPGGHSRWSTDGDLLKNLEFAGGKINLFTNKRVNGKLKLIGGIPVFNDKDLTLARTADIVGGNSNSYLSTNSTGKFILELAEEEYANIRIPLGVDAYSPIELIDGTFLHTDGEITFRAVDDLHPDAPDNDTYSKFRWYWVLGQNNMEESSTGIKITAPTDKIELRPGGNFEDLYIANQIEIGSGWSWVDAEHEEPSVFTEVKCQTIGDFSAFSKEGDSPIE